MHKEIGSEYWGEIFEISQENIWDKYNGEKRFYLSGRSALYAIIEDILSKHECKQAYLPAYCCDSMVEPFRCLGLDVSFYEVKNDQGIHSNIDPDYSCDIILTMDYFGYATMPQRLPKAIHIHDVTHSMLSVPAYTSADYYFGSLRKWGPIAALGFACKTKAGFCTEKWTKPNRTFVDLRYKGYKLKNSYINAGEGDKQSFLKLFSQAEELLDQDYIGYSADPISMSCVGNISGTGITRRKNAEVLIKGLETSRLVSPVFTRLAENDVPLFVPIIVGNGLRNQLRKDLIDHQVYCPVHWPVHDGCSGELYKNELSLICDQRYTEADMLRQLALIQDFEERYGKQK